MVKAEISALKTHIFCAERILEDQSQLQFYTGFSSKKMFMACFNFLKLSMESLVSWQGQRTKPAVERHCLKPRREKKLSTINQFFSVLVRLRRALPLEDLADRFKVSISTLSRFFTTWINLINVKFRELLVWPYWRRGDRNMPECFRRLIHQHV